MGVGAQEQPTGPSPGTQSPWLKTWSLGNSYRATQGTQVCTMQKRGLR